MTPAKSRRRRKRGIKISTAGTDTTEKAMVARRPFRPSKK